MSLLIYLYFLLIMTLGGPLARGGVEVGGDVRAAGRRRVEGRPSRFLCALLFGEWSSWGHGILVYER